MKKICFAVLCVLMLAIAAVSFADDMKLPQNLEAEEDEAAGGMTDQELDAHWVSGMNYLLDGQYGIVNASRVKVRPEPDSNRSCKRNGKEARMGKNMAVVIVDTVTNEMGIQMYEVWTTWAHGYIPTKYVTLKDDWTEDDYRAWMHNHNDFYRDGVDYVIKVNGVELEDDDGYVIKWDADGNVTVLDQDGNVVKDAAVTEAAE